MRNPKESIWNHFIKALPLTLLAVLIAGTVGVIAGTNLDSPAAPGSTSSYTLEDLYQRLVNGTDGSQSTFSEPGVAPGSGTMHDINALMAAAPEADPNGATSADVLTGTTFWGLTNGEWGEQTGGMPLGSDFTGGDGLLTFDVPDGFYSGNTATAYDADLLAGNILDTVDIFGVTGSIPVRGDVYGANGVISFAIPDGYYSGRTATARDFDLLAENILSTANIFGIAGSLATGSDVTGSDGSLTFNIPDACYSGNTASAADADLIAANIRHGVTLFGVTGTYQTGWYLHSTMTPASQILAISMVNSTDGWAVGDGGRIYHWDGTAWSLYTTVGFSGFGDMLVDVDAVSSTDVWAVGIDGFIEHWDGNYWSLTLTTERSYLSAVSMVSSTDGWAVGQFGRIYHWNGTDWSLHTTTVEGVNFTDIDMVSSTDGWAVAVAGHIYHWDGTDWSLHTDTDDGFPLEGISMVSSTDGWAVGVKGQIYHWDGTDWSLHTTTTEVATLWGVDMVSENDGWAVGDDSYLYHWDGTYWSLRTATGGSNILIAVDMVDSGDGWTVGDNGRIYIFSD